MRQAALIPDYDEDQFVTDTKLRIVLPYPPSVNSANAYRTQLPSIEAIRQAMHGATASELRKWFQRKLFTQTYKTQESKDFNVAVWALVSKLGARKKWAHEMRVTMTVHPPDRRRRDSSNLWKMVEDSLEKAGVFEDDSQLKEHHSYFREPVKGGMVVVELEPLV